MLVLCKSSATLKPAQDQKEKKIENTANKYSRARTQRFTWFDNVPTSTGKCNSSSSH